MIAATSQNHPVMMFMRGFSGVGNEGGITKIGQARFDYYEHFGEGAPESASVEALRTAIEKNQRLGNG